MKVDCLLARQPRCGLLAESRQVKPRLAPSHDGRTGLRLGFLVDRTVSHVF
jgi:hypothetical protein